LNVFNMVGTQHRACDRMDVMTFTGEVWKIKRERTGAITKTKQNKERMIKRSQ